MSGLVKWSMTPTNYGEARDFALAISKSGLAPKDYIGKPENALIAMAMGADVGLSPMQAIQNISVINGRPSLWGDAMLAIVQAHPDFVDFVETNDGVTATATLTLRGRAPTTQSFTVDDAKKAGLWNKQGPWQTNPKRMLQMRARSFCLRDGAAYILKGLGSAEENADIETAPAREVRATVVERFQDLGGGATAANTAAAPKALPKADGPRFSPKWEVGQWGGTLLSEAPDKVLSQYLADLNDTDVSDAAEATQLRVAKFIGDVSAEIRRREPQAKARADVMQNSKAAAAIYGEPETSEDDVVDPETGELVNQKPDWGLEPEVTT